MSSVLPKHVKLPMQLLTPNRSDRTVEVDSVRPRRKIDPETRKPTNEVEGYTLDFIANKGSIQSVKLPLSVEPQIREIEKALHDNSIVKVNFGTPSTFVGRFYAMLNGNGGILQGISCTASTVEIVEIEKSEPDVFPDFDVEP